MQHRYALEMFRQSLGRQSEKNIAAAKAILQLEETKLGYFEKTLTLDQKTSLYSTIWIKQKHVDLARTENLPNLAKVLKRALEIDAQNRPSVQSSRKSVPRATPR